MLVCYKIKMSKIFLRKPFFFNTLINSQLKWKYFVMIYVTLDHKTSHWGIFAAIAKNTLYGYKIINFSFMLKIIRILHKDI